MGKLDWRRAQLDPRPKLSIADEADFRSRDAAARWLERNESKRQLTIDAKVKKQKRKKRK